MFTILNIINYFTGKYIPFTILVLITIGIYYYIITSCSDSIFSNDYYVILLLILMLIDITSLIVIFIYGDFLNFDSNSNDVISYKKDKKDKKDKKNKKDKKDEKDKKDKKLLIENKFEVNNNTTNNVDNLEKNKEIISLYDNEKPGSIHTFAKFR